MPPIKKSDVVQDKQIIKAFEDINAAVKASIDAIIGLTAESKKMSAALQGGNMSDLSAASSKYTANLAEQTKAEQEIIKLEKLKLSLANEVTKSEQAKIKALEASEKAAKSKANEELKAAKAAEKAAKDAAKEADKLAKASEKAAKAAAEEASAYAKKNKELTEARKKASDLGVEYGTTSKQFKDAAANVNKLDKELKKIDSELGQNQRNVGNYGKIWGEVKSNVTGLALSFVGITAVFNSVTALIGRAWKNAVDFGKALSSLKAITGATAKDMAFFASEAVAMSKNTQKSAVEIIKAFELVGSKAPELLKSRDALKDVTKWSIILSESSGGQLQLADSVNAVTAAMSVFGLGAEEAARIANVFAAGSLAGSAGVDQLSEAFKNVGPVAKTSNLTLEQTVALLEVLGEKQIYGAEAGTKLRGSLLRLKDASLGYQSGTFNLTDALNEANAKMATFGTQLERDAYMAKVFGAENITVGTILLQNTDKYDSLTKAVTGTNTAMDQQKIQNDNVAGSLSLLANKWDGFLLSLNDSNGIVKKAIDALSALIDELSWLTMDDAAKQAKMTADELERMANITANMTVSEQIGAYEKYLKKVGVAIGENKKELNSFAIDVKDGLKPIIDQWELFGLRTSEAVNNELEANRALAKAARDKINNLYASRDAIKEETKAIAENQAAITGESSNEGLNKSYEKKLEAKKEDLQLSVEIIDMDKVMTDQQMKNVDLLAKYKDEARALELEKEKEDAETKKGILQDLYDSSIALVNTLFERRIQTLENEKNAVDEKYAKILANEQLTEEQRSALEAKRDAEKQAIEEKQNKARRRQAQFDKAISLMNIFNSTREAIMKAWTLLPPANAIFAGLAAATGAIQAAAVVATPIPQYFKGVKDSPETIAEVGERGPELIDDPKKGLWLARDRQLTHLSKGSTVYTAAETARKLDNMRRADIMAQGNPAMMRDSQLNRYIASSIEQGKAIEAAIAKQRGYTIINTPGINSRVSAKNSAFLSKMSK